MMELLFSNPVFHKGLNVTVRSGPKWAFQVSPGDEVQIRKTDGDVVGKGLIIMARLIDFEELPEVWLRYEHDPSCRTKDGLRKELHRVYGDVLASGVTVIFFEYLE